MTSYQDGSGADASASYRRYWTLAANPARYRVVDAVRDLEEDWWLAGRGDLHVGDRAAIWKYKGRDDHRGIIAFGEVITDPELRDELDDDTYWIDSDGQAAALRVRVRYVIKPAEPLWLELAPADSVLRRLPVSRAQGGTAHHVTSDQWAQLMALVGGWPESDGDQLDPPDWTDSEIQPTVIAYFAMLRAELAGQPYVKTAFNRQVQAAAGRSRGAVEYKFQNISAVLRDLGLPYVQGYKPAPNLQTALRAEVERFLTRDPESQRLIDEMPAPDVPPTARLVEVDPPVMAPPSTRGRGRITTAAIDYLERQARNRDIGLQGERLIVEHERAWLSAHGRPDLAEQVAHVPSTLGDGAGYDVRSFLLDGSPHHIEVKATRGSINAPFFLSANELRHALEHPETYSIYRIFDLGPNLRFYRLTGDMNEILDLTPVSYQARVKAPGARSTPQG
jgi:hypothetical protein